MSQIIKVENDSLSYLNVFLKENSPRRILLVTGKKSYKACGAQLELEPILKDYHYTRFFDFEENPKIEDVEKGVQLFNDNNCQLIIAVGGGSVMDMAKLINIFHKVSIPIANCLKVGKCGKDIVPMVAIPTTFGSGSESTHFAVVYQNKIKYSVANKIMLPGLVLLNSSFSRTLSPYLKAITGLDAFSQAIESFWNINSNEESIRYSKEAIELIWKYLPLYVKENDKKAAEKICQASNLAGKAINITKTTAPHAISYPFTSYFGIPHGHAVSLLLPFFLEYNYNVTEKDLNDKRGVNAVKKNILYICSLIGASSVIEGKELLINFIKNIGVESKVITSCQDNNKNIETILTNINLERLGNNPREVDKKLLKNFLKEIFKFEV
jgi:alcohol dehydrogenase class IV